jgi:hypothetical protein
MFIQELALVRPSELKDNVYDNDNSSVYGFSKDTFDYPVIP